MRLLLRKQKTDVAEFSRDFYDRFVFCTDFLGGQAPSVFAESVRRAVGKVNAAFLTVPVEKLTDELLALRMEVVGMAWADASREEAALANSAFTREYLAAIGRSALWKSMHKYNEAIAHSLVDTRDRNSFWARWKRCASNSYRTDVFDLLLAKGHDPETMGRVVNRMGLRARNKVATSIYLAIWLLRSLEFERSESVIDPLGAIIYGFYQGAKHGLDGVKLMARDIISPGDGCL